MQDFHDKVAVVTGAASGIGRAMALRFGAEGMRVVLADIEREALHAVEAELSAKGVPVLALVTDVSIAEDVEKLAHRAFKTFGAVHILCNNAGVGNHFSTCWDRSLSDWQWLLGVNLWGVIHGIHAFVPGMLQRGMEGHVINTASIAGLLSGPFLGDYHTSKFAVVALSESLQHELTLTGAKVRAHVLCPGFVNTRIVDAHRNRPAGLTDENPQSLPNSGFFEQGFKDLVSNGMPPEKVAERVLDAVRQDRFYILTHPEWKPTIAERTEAILAERNPHWKLADMLALPGSVSTAD